jgi:glyoxylase-like metal-dependent hydrolase (beta-lactamase superfamily II)
MSAWEEIEPGVYRFRDSCLVYAMEGEEGAWLIVNAGTGAAAGHLPALGPVCSSVLLLTHHFRDHTAGAEQFRAAGARVAAPWHEREHLSDGQRAMRAKQTLFLYDLMWDHYAPIRPIVVDRWMNDYETATLAGLTVTVVPTPGVTMGAASYIVTRPDGRRLAFVGELMGSPGKLARIAPLQYNYNDLTGLENVLLSWRRVLEAQPALALPSMGEPIANCAAAVEQLCRSAAQFEAVQPGITARLTQASRDGIEEVVPRLYRARSASAETHFLLSKSGKALAIDFGYDTSGVRFPNRLDSWTRRPLLHSVSALRAVTGVARIEVVIPTHYHDDHIAGIPLLQRLHGTELWAGENFADLLERPADFDRPCLWPEPLKVSRRLALGHTFHWEDIAITLRPMSGHTEFSTLVLLEFDGRRIAHTGDQLFYLDPATLQLTAPEKGSVFSNHVYRNGLELGCYVDFVRRLRAFDPELILSGHYVPYRSTPGLWGRLERAAQAFDEAHRAVLELRDDRTHFGIEGQAAKIFPYESRMERAQSRQPIRGWVLNPCDRPATAEIRFAASADGITIEALVLPLPARRKKSFRTAVAVAAGTRPGRHAITLELVVDGRNFGQVAEAWLRVE